MYSQPHIQACLCESVWHHCLVIYSDEYRIYPSCLYIFRNLLCPAYDRYAPECLPLLWICIHIGDSGDFEFIKTIQQHSFQNII